MTRVLIVERPGPFRDALLHEVSQRGVEAHVRDDAMDALASIERLTPHVILVSDDPGPPGALGLCRVLQRKLDRALLYRLGEPSLADQLDERSVILPRALGAGAVAAAIFDRANDNANRVAPRAWEGAIGSLELGPLLLAIEARWLTGRLLITRPGTEREIVFMRGLPVHARSTVLSERIGTIALRRGVLSEAQLEYAVDFARARSVRIGAAMIELGLIDATGLMRLLGVQLVEQLVAACNAGATTARFILDHAVLSRYPLQRMSGMTALLGAVALTPESDLRSVLDELSAQPITAEPLPPVERWLSELQLSDAVALSDTTLDSVGVLRERLRGVALTDGAGRALSGDTVAFALLRSGVFRMRKLSDPAHADLRASVRTLSPPSLVNAAVRCAHVDYSRWPLTGITRSRTPLEQAIDVSLHGKRVPEQARAVALRGPEADCDERFGEVYRVLLREEQPSGPLATGESARPLSLSDVRLACHAQLKRVDALEAENLGGLCRVHLLQTRERLERWLDVLPAPELREHSASRPAAPAGVPEPSSQPEPAAATPASPAQSPELEPAATMAAEAQAPGPPQVAEPAQTVAATSAAVEPAVGAGPASEPVAGSDLLKTPAERLAASAQERALLEAAEPLLEQGRWRDLRLLLAPDSANAVSLPPVLALLYAVALKEDPPASRHESHAPPAGAAESIAITVVQQLFDLHEQSAVAVLLAKRLLRRRQLDWKQKPPARVSALLVGSALLFGALVGFLLHPSLLNLLYK